MLDPRIPLMAEGIPIEPRMNALMRAGQMQGMQQQNAMREMQMQQLRQAMAAEAEQRKRKEAQQQEMQGYLASLSGRAGPPQQFNPMEALMRTRDPKIVEFLANAPTMGLPKVARVLEQAGPDGRPQSMQFDEFGRPVGAAVAKPVEAKMMDLGGTKQAYDPYAVKPGQSFRSTMTPGEIASDARARDRLRLDQDKFLFDKSKPGAAAGGQPTGEERKAATLLQRLRGSQAQLQAVTEENAGAAKPEVLAEVARRTPFVGGDTTANIFTSEDRQRVEAAQLDLLDAALTLGTGAAYTREQLEGYRRSYFPQIGDDPNTIKDKQSRLQNVIRAAEIAAGRADPGAATRSVTVDY